MTPANPPGPMPEMSESIVDLARRKARVKVMVSVKASPQPSETYGDTVCVAGTLMGSIPRWIRLYPVPFRYLDGPQQFNKYAVLDVELHESTGDKRPESAKINLANLRVEPALPPWDMRKPWVEPLVDSTMCSMLDAVKNYLNAPSLGAIRPAKVDPRLRFEVHNGWTPKQTAVLAAAESQGVGLFGPPPPALLVPPRFKVALHYWCQEPGCNSHAQGILDWELTALQRRGSKLDDEALKATIQDKFMTQMFNPDKDPIIFVGNQADVMRRRTFSVLGVYYPKRKPPSLFDL